MDVHLRKAVLRRWKTDEVVSKSFMSERATSVLK